MDVGIQMIFSTYGWPGMSDREAWQEEIRLARLADELGFDVIWSVEHHFSDYSFCPDNTQLLSYLAPLCTHADLGTAAIILPWHDPLRVAENAAVVDMLCKGKLRLGLGRGLARREFAAFRVSMDESRERFDEAAPMIVNAPVMSQTTSSQPADPVCRAMSAETMKMPEPIIAPATIMVESNRPMP